MLIRMTLLFFVILLCSCGPVQPIAEVILGKDRKIYAAKGDPYCRGLDPSDGAYGYYGCGKKDYQY